MTCTIAIRVTPRSSRPGIGGWRRAADAREELEVRVAAAPADGEANSAVVALLAKHLSLAKRDVEIVSGASSRHKKVSIPLTEEEFRSRLGL